MNHRFNPLLPKDVLRPPVLVVAAHPDDEVIGAGGLLAWHGMQGHRVIVVHATDGAQGDPSGMQQDIRAVRRAEGREALQRLGITDLRHWDLPDGCLPEHVDAITSRLRALFAEVQPKTFYGFWFAEAHRDHQAMAVATVRAAGALPADCRCMLFGVNNVPSGGTLFDTTDVHERKKHALRAYASQLAYIDFAALSDHRDRVAMVNVDIPGVTHGELYADLLPHELERALALAEPLQAMLTERVR